MTGPAAPGSVIPAGPVLSMFNPVHVGIDEFGAPVHTRVIYKNLLAAGEPGGGKSGLMNILTAHAALSARSRLVLFDGKQVELGLWDAIADEFVGPDLDHAITTLRRLQRVMDNRYAWLRARQRRKIEPGNDITVITSVFDEIALYSTVLGTEQQQKEFVTLLRDLVARGRAAAMPVIAATQRPSVKPRTGLPDHRRRHPPPHQSRLPVRRRHHHPGRPRRSPAPHRGLNTHRKETCHAQHRPGHPQSVYHQPARPRRLPQRPPRHPGSPVRNHYQPES